VAETIADYLVKLGLQVDKAQEQRFNASLSNLSKTLTWMAAGLTAAATTIQATVIAVSKSFDTLYFAAQRTNSTVAGIKSLSYAFSQIGGSADEAMSAIGGLAKALRTNPEGMTKWLNLQGVETKGKNVKQILMDAADVFSGKDYRLGYQFAERIGISEETWNKWVKNKDQIRQFEKEFAATQAKFGVDPDKAAAASNDLMTSFRSLMLHVSALLEKITIELQPQLNRMLKDISEWIEKHQDQIVRILNNIINAVKGLADDLGWLATKLKPVVEQFSALVEAVSGKSGLHVAMEALLVFMAGAWLKGMLATFTALMAHPAFAVLAAIAGGGMILYGGLTTSDADKKAMNDAIDNTPWGKRVLGWMDRNVWSPLGVSPNKANGASGGYGDGGASGDWTNDQKPPAAGLAPVKTKSGKVAWVDAKMQRQFQGFLRDIEERGYSIDDIGGYDVRANANDPSKMSVHSYGRAIDINPRQNPNGSRRTDLPPDTGEIAKKWGLFWGMNFSRTPDPMHITGDPSEHGRQMSPDELDRLEQEQRDRLKDKQSQLFGAPALGSSQTRMASLSNRTNITIYGSSDPAGTAASLGGAQNRIASELIRNTQSAFV